MCPFHRLHSVGVELAKQTGVSQPPTHLMWPYGVSDIARSLQETYVKSLIARGCTYTKYLTSPG